MPSETEQLKVKILLADSKIKIFPENYKKFQEYLTNGQNNTRTTFCMLGSKLLRIQVSVPSQENKIDQLEVKSVGALNGNNVWENQEIKKIKELFDFSEAEEKEIEIFKSLGSRVEKLEGEKRELQTQLAKAEQEKNKELEAAKQQAEKEQQELQTQLTQANANLETAKEAAEKEKINLQTQLEEVEELKAELVAKDEEIKTLHDKVTMLETAQQNGADAQLQEKEIKELEAAKQQANKEIKTLQDELSQARGCIQQLAQENQELRDYFFPIHNQAQRLKQENQRLTEELKELREENKEIGNKLSGNAPPERLEWEEELDTQIEELQEQLKAKVEEIAQLNAKVEELNKGLEAQNTKVKQLESEKSALEAKKQPTEQPKQSKAPTHTAAVGVGLATGLAAFIALERTVRLDIWVTVGIAVVAALAISGGTYLALKPSTQVSEAETQEVNKKCCNKTA